MQREKSNLKEHSDSVVPSLKARCFEHKSVARALDARARAWLVKTFFAVATKDFKDTVHSMNREGRIS